jgi:hypothetical protein
MPKIILFNADDWGLSAKIHQAITSLADQNAIDAAGIMVGQKFTREAVDYAKANEHLKVGLHLFANDPDCQPLTRDAWPPHWPGYFDFLGRLILPMDTDLILAEVRAQLLAYRETGLRLDFINGHFHFHAHPRVRKAIQHEIRQTFPRFTGWLRLGDIRLFPLGKIPRLQGIPDTLARTILGTLQRGSGDWTGLKNDTLWGLDSTFKNNAADITRVTQSLGDGFHEFFFHPGRGRHLTDDSTDHAALLELATRLPASARNVSLLPGPG